MHWLFAAVLALTQHWLVLGDVHLDPFDRSPQPSTYGSDSNWALVRSSLEAMKKAQPDPAVVVIAGDLLAHQWQAKAQAAHVDPTRAAEQSFADLARIFGRAFPHAQFILAMGNNDDPCGDYRTGRDSAYRAAIADAWKPLVDRGNAAPFFVRDFVHGGYYAARLAGGATALVLDDIYWSIVYRSCGNGSDAAGEFAWFERQLGALHASQRAIPVMHIPPGVDVTSTLLAHGFLIVPYWNGGALSRFERDVNRHRAQIPFAIAGHVHHGDFRELGGIPTLVVSSISPIYNNNPSFDLLDVGANKVPADVRMVAFDEDAQTWDGAFDFARTFGAQGFTMQNLAAAHTRIAQDPQTRELWERSIDSNSDAWPQVRRAWLAYWCAQAQTGGGFSACAGDRRRTTAVWALLAVLVVAVVAAVWYSRSRLWKRRQRNGA